MIYGFERELTEKRGFSACCGTDEAGRGPLAGPVYAAAVYLGAVRIEGIDDSKKLTEKKREALFAQITAQAHYAVAKASVEEIEAFNILGASQLAMRRAVEDLCSRIQSDVVLVDGNIARGFPIPAICVVGGDAKCASIAAASILAKVSRDREMVEMDRLYPDYGFAKHKGYPTKQHYEAIRQYGTLPIHRMSFLKKLADKTPGAAEPTKEASSRIRGCLGEELALGFLKEAGYTALGRNFRSYAGEIDLIVKKDGYVVFVEVKLRKNRHFAEAAEFVDFRKTEKIKKTAGFWLLKNGENLQPRFDVIEVYSEEKSAAKAEIRHIVAAF